MGILDFIKRPRHPDHPNRKASLRGRSQVYNLLDNIIGFDDDRVTAGEAFAASLRAEPVRTAGRVAKAVSDDLDNLMFEGGAMARPQDVLGYAGGATALGGLAFKRVGARPKRSRKAGSDFGEGWSDAYHWTRSADGIDQFDPDRSTQAMSRLGPHVGTRAAAEARIKAFPKDAEAGQMLKLKADTRRPFLNPRTKGPWSEADLEDLISRVADEHGVDRRQAAPLMRRMLSDQGYTDIPYTNNVEDAGSISNIMLVDRPKGSDAVLRKSDAAFDPPRRTSPNLIAANASKRAGLLGAATSGKAPNKAELDPLGYQKTKMRGYLSDVDVNLKDTGENLSRTPMSWEAMEGKVVLPFYGDRTSRGLLVEGVSNKRFDQPVYTEGGVDFMRGPAAQKDRAIWASNQNIVKRIEKEADKASRNFEGRDIVGLTGSMAPDANDFATMTGAAMAELVKGASITKKSAKEFDSVMRAVDPDFVGVLSPNLREWTTSTSSPKRKAFIRLMDSQPMQAAGFPSPAEARYAVTDPTQRDMPAGMFGLGAARIDTSTPLMFNTPKGNKPAASVPHSTYNTQIAGDYMGSLEPVPQGLLFKDVYDAMEGKKTKAGQPLTSAHKTHAIKTKMPAQEVTPEILDGILSYLSRLGR